MTEQREALERSIQRGEEIVNRYVNAMGIDRKDAICDILADLMLWCRDEKVDFYREYARASDAHALDLKDQEAAKRRTRTGYTVWDRNDPKGPGTRDSEVEVELRDGTVSRGKVSDFHWLLDDVPTDIFSYKFLQIAAPVPAKPRYVFGDWTHIFDFGQEKMTKFVFDRQVNAVIHMRVEGMMGWFAADAGHRADLTDSLVNANEEALEKPEEYGLEESDGLPAWVMED